MSLTLTNARIPGERGLMGSLINVVIDHGYIADIEFVGATGVINLDAPLDSNTLDLGGRYLIPGLWDAHTRFTPWAIKRAGLSEDATREQIDAAVADAVQAAAARGVVGIVDFQRAWTVADWRRRIGAGIDHLKVEFAVFAEHIETAIEAGMRSGDVIASTEGLLSVGPLTIVTDGALKPRKSFCHDSYDGVAGPTARGILKVEYDRLVSIMNRAHSAGLELAVHAVGDAAVTYALNAFEAVGVQGSIERAQLIAWDDIHRFADLGITASVQPELALVERELADALWAGRTDRAFPLATLVNAGVSLAFGSDAPHSPLDPWLGIAAAVERTRGGDDPWHPEQRIAPEAALAASTRTRIAVGEPADLAVVEYDPLFSSVDELRQMPVAATFLGGRLTHSTL
jgi:predicted amidohydrolase YtcJ